MLFSLGLEDRMIGTAFMDDPILPQFEEVHASVPVLSEDFYASKEVILAAEPDFIYSSYWGAFHEMTGGERAELQALGINTYVVSNKCFDESQRPEEVTFDTLFEEIRTLGRIFAVEDRAEALIAQEQAKLDAALAQIPADAEPLDVIWYDSGVDELLIAPCCNPQTMIIEAAGAHNLFDDFAGDWAEVGWEPVIDHDPELIIVTDALWGSATEKIALLESNPLSQDLAAVQNQRYVSLPFSASQLGVRNADAALILVQALYGDQ